MADNNVYLIWSGHITTDVEKEVLTFTETKLTEEDVELTLREKNFSVLVEILEMLPGTVPVRSPRKNTVCRWP